MLIKKTFQGTIPENKILNKDSESQTDTYSCAKINEMISNTGGGTSSTLPNHIANITEEQISQWNTEIEEPNIYNGTTTPDATLGKDGDIYILYTA